VGDRLAVDLEEAQALCLHHPHRMGRFVEQRAVALLRGAQGLGRAALLAPEPGLMLVDFVRVRQAERREMYRLWPGQRGSGREGEGMVDAG